MTAAELKDYFTIAGMVLAWGAAVFGWSNRQSKRRAAAIKEQLRVEINGVGSRLQGTEVEVGRLMSAAEVLEREFSLMKQEGVHATREVALLREDVKQTREAAERRESASQKSFLEVMVKLGELGTKVDILLKLEDRNNG